MINALLLFVTLGSEITHLRNLQWWSFSRPYCHLHQSSVAHIDFILQWDLLLSLLYLPPLISLDNLRWFLASWDYFGFQRLRKNWVHRCIWPIHLTDGRSPIRPHFNFVHIINSCIIIIINFCVNIFISLKTFSQCDTCSVVYTLLSP